MIEGCDYSWSRPDPACLAGRGMAFVGRYLLTTDPAKTLTLAEARRLDQAGLAIVAIHQPSNDKGWMLGGFARGKAAAHDALRVAAQLGMPDDRPFTYPLDIDPGPLTAAQWDQVRQCLRGAASVHGLDRTGVYGGWLAIDRLMPRYAAWGYQTRSWSSVAGQVRWHPRAQLRQYSHNQVLCGGQIDYVRATTADYGQWRPGQGPAAWWLRPLDAGQRAQLRGAFTEALR